MAEPDKGPVFAVLHSNSGRPRGSASGTAHLVTLVPGSSYGSPAVRSPLSRGDALGQGSGSGSVLKRQAPGLTAQASRSDSVRGSRVSQAGLAAVKALGSSNLSRQRGSASGGGAAGDGDNRLSSSGHLRRLPSGIKRNQSLVPAASFRDRSGADSEKRLRSSTAGYGGFSGRSSAAGEEESDTPRSTLGGRRSSGLAPKQSVTLTGHEHDHRVMQEQASRALARMKTMSMSRAASRITREPSTSGGGAEEEQGQQGSDDPMSLVSAFAPGAAHLPQLPPDLGRWSSSNLDASLENAGVFGSSGGHLRSSMTGAFAAAAGAGADHTPASPDPSARRGGISFGDNTPASGAREALLGNPPSTARNMQRRVSIAGPGILDQPRARVPGSGGLKGSRGRRFTEWEGTSGEGGTVDQAPRSSLLQRPGHHQGEAAASGGAPGAGATSVPPGTSLTDLILARAATGLPGSQQQPPAPPAPAAAAAAAAHTPLWPPPAPPKAGFRFASGGSTLVKDPDQLQAQAALGQGLSAGGAAQKQQDQPPSLGKEEEEGGVKNAWQAASPTGGIVGILRPGGTKRPPPLEHVHLNSCSPSSSRAASPLPDNAAAGAASVLSPTTYGPPSPGATRLTFAELPDVVARAARSPSPVSTTTPPGSKEFMFNPFSMSPKGLSPGGVTSRARGSAWGGSEGGMSTFTGTGTEGGRSPNSARHRKSGRTFSRAALRKEIAVPVVVPDLTFNQPPKPPPSLVALEDIEDEDLRALFKEVQEFGIHQSVAEALGSLDEATLRAMYKRASQRLENLPSAIVSKVSGQLMLVELPGPRGVLGFDVDAKGEVYRSEKRRIGRYLAQTAIAQQLLRQVQELEDQGPEPVAGLEADPALVKLWRELGGRKARHTQAAPTPAAANHSNSGAAPGHSTMTASRDHAGNMASGLPTSRSSSHSSYVHPRSAIKRISTRGSTRAGPAGGTGGRRESTGAHGLKAPPSSDPHQHQNSSKGRKPSYTGSSPFTSSFKKSSLARVSDKGTGDVWQQGLTGAQSFARVSISGVSTGGRRESQGWGPSQSGRRSSLRFNAPSPQGEGVASRIASMARTMSASTDISRPGSAGTSASSVWQDALRTFSPTNSMGTGPVMRASRKDKRKADAQHQHLGYYAQLMDQIAALTPPPAATDERGMKQGFMPKAATGLLDGGTVEAKKESLARMVESLRYAPMRIDRGSSQAGDGEGLGEHLFEPSDGEVDPDFQFLAQSSDVSYDGYDDLWDTEQGGSEEEGDEKSDQESRSHPQRVRRMSRSSTSSSTQSGAGRAPLAGSGGSTALFLQKALEKTDSYDPSTAQAGHVHYGPPNEAFTFLSDDLSPRGRPEEGAGSGGGNGGSPASPFPVSPSHLRRPSVLNSPNARTSVMGVLKSGRQSSVGQPLPALDGEEEGGSEGEEGEDPDLSTAFKDLQSALAKGKKAKVRRRSVPGEAPKPRTFREAAAAVKLGARISGALGALRRTTGQGGSGAVDRLLASAAGAMGSSNLASALSSVFGGGDASSSGSNANTGAEARVSGQAVDLLLGQNSEVFWQDGDRRVRLTTGEVEKVGHIVDRWITGTETGDTQVMSVDRLKEVLLQASAPEGMESKGHIGSVSMSLTKAWGPEMNAWLPTEDEIRAGEPREPRVAPKTVERRLKQGEATGEGKLDLALAPRLARVDVGVVYQELRKVPGITRIVAMDALLTPGGVGGVLALVKACPWLQELDLTNCKSMGPDNAEALGEALHPRHKLALTHLTLAGCPILDEGFHGLALGLQFNRKLVMLDLTRCGLTDKGLKTLDRVLEQNVVLSVLNLSENQFGAPGIATLAKDVCANVALRELRLQSCGLGDECAEHLSSLITGARGLHLLDLSNNGITGLGAAHLALALSRLEHPDNLPASLVRTRLLPPSSTTTINNSSATSLAGPKASGGLAQRFSVNATYGGASLTSPKPSLSGLPVSRPSNAGGSSGGAGVAVNLGLLPAGAVVPAAGTGSSSTPRDGVPTARLSCLHTLLLHDNPLGRTGVTLILHALQELYGTQPGSCLRRLGLNNVDVNAPSHGTPLLFDHEKPNGSYTLNLSNPQDREIATQLVALFDESGGHAWLRASLDAAPLDLVPHHHGWPGGMPDEGVLKVSVIRRATVPPDAPPLSPVLEACVLSQLRSDRVSDIWRGLMVARVTNVAYVAAEQAARMLACFNYRGERIDAASLLLSMCVDLHAFLPAITAPEAPLSLLAPGDARHDALTLLSPQRGLPQSFSLDNLRDLLSTSGAASFSASTVTSPAMGGGNAENGAGYAGRAYSRSTTFASLGGNGGVGDHGAALSRTNTLVSRQATLTMSRSSSMFRALPLEPVSPRGGGLSRSTTRRSLTYLGPDAAAIEAASKASAVTAGEVLLGWQVAEEEERAAHRSPLGPALAPEEVLDLLNDDGLQVLELMPGKNALLLGWQAACSGHYRLDLDQQVHRLLAVELLGLAHHRLHPCPLLTLGSALYPEWPSHLPGLSGDTALAIRNLVVAGLSLAGISLLPTPAQLPHTGILVADVVNTHNRSIIGATYTATLRGPHKAPAALAGTPQAAAAKGSGALGGVAQVAALASSAATAGALLPPALAPAAGAGPAQGGQYNRNTPEPVRRRSVDMLGPGVGSTPRGTGASSGGGAAPAAAAGSGAAAAAALSSFSRIASGRVSNTGMAMMTPPSFSMAGPTRLGSVVNPGSAYPSSNHPSTSTGHGSAAYTSGAAAAAAAAGQALSASALKARAKRVEAGQAFESLYISCLTHLGLSSGDPRLRGWLDAADVLAAPSYAELFEHYRGERRERHARYAAMVRPPTIMEESTAADTGKGGKKGGKKPKGPSKAAIKAEREAARAAAEAEELREERLQGATKAAATVVPLMTAHAIKYTVTSLQLLHLLRLLPEVDMRATVLVALYPSLQDPPNLVEALLALDSPVPLRLLPEEQAQLNALPPSQQAIHASHSMLHNRLGTSSYSGAGAAGVVRSSVTGAAAVAAQQRAAQQHSLPLGIAHPLQGMLDSACSAPRGWVPPGTPPPQQSAGNSGLDTKAQSQSQPKAPAAGPAGAGSGASFTGGTSIGEEVTPASASTRLLGMALHRLGWRQLVPHWSLPGLLDGVPISLDMTRAEDISAAHRFCRFADRCRTQPGYERTPVLVSVTTDAGAVELEHVGLWSYWEQVLGWICARPPPQGPDPSTLQALFPPGSQKASFTHQKAGAGPAAGAGGSRAGSVSTAAGGSKPPSFISPKSVTTSKGSVTKAGGKSSSSLTSKAQQQLLAQQLLPKLGKFVIQLSYTAAQQQWSAAVLIQAAWRGRRTRKAIAKSLRIEAARGAWEDAPPIRPPATPRTPLPQPTPRSYGPESFEKLDFGLGPSPSFASGAGAAKSGAGGAGGGSKGETSGANNDSGDGVEGEAALEKAARKADAVRGPWAPEWPHLGKRQAALDPDVLLKHMGPLTSISVVHPPPPPPPPPKEPDEDLHLHTSHSHHHSFSNFNFNLPAVMPPRLAGGSPTDQQGAPLTRGSAATTAGGASVMMGSEGPEASPQKEDSGDSQDPTTQKGLRSRGPSRPTTATTRPGLSRSTSVALRAMGHSMSGAALGAGLQPDGPSPFTQQPPGTEASHPGLTADNSSTSSSSASTGEGVRSVIVATGGAEGGLVGGARSFRFRDDPVDTHLGGDGGDEDHPSSSSPGAGGGGGGDGGEGQSGLSTRRSGALSNRPSGVHNLKRTKSRRSEYPDIEVEYAPGTGPHQAPVIPAGYHPPARRGAPHSRRPSEEAHLTAAARWKGAWAVFKFLKRVAQMQRLGGQMMLDHARKEMAANAGHLFPA